MRLLVALLAAWLLAAPMAVAQEPAAPPDMALADPAQEARAQALFQDIRCVVCQHESIADSPAGIAGDQRRLVRERIGGGASDAAIRAELVERYGDFILFRPPLRASTALLWLTPFLIGLGGLSAFIVWSRRRVEPAAPLSAEEEAALEALIRPHSDGTSPHDGR